MSSLRRFPFRPMEARPPDLTVSAFQTALQAALDQAAKRETSVVYFVPGCDGRNIVTAYQGSCQDQARASAGGQAGVGVDLGNGARVVLARDMGRGYSASSGYSGAGLSNGAFPAPLSAAAVDLALDPIDSVSGVAIEGEPADIGVAMMGATISGKTGEGRFTAYGLTGGSASPPYPTYKLWYWADCTAADPPVQVTTSAPDMYTTDFYPGLMQVEMISPTRAVALERAEGKLYFYEDGAEVGTYEITSFTNTRSAHWPSKAFKFYLIPGTDGDEMIAAGYVETHESWSVVDTRLVHITGLLSGSCVEAHTWTQDTTPTNHDYIRIEAVAVGADGTVYIGGAITDLDHSDGSPTYYEYGYWTPYQRIMQWSPPYTSPPSLYHERTVGSLGPGPWQAFRCRETDAPGAWLLARVASTPSGIEQWQRVIGQWINMPTGFTPIEAYCFFDSANYLWIWATEDSSGDTYLLRYRADDLGYGATASIPITFPGGRAYDFSGDLMSADGNYMFFLGTDTAAPHGFSFMRAPYVAGAAITEVASPDTVDPVYWLTVPHAHDLDVPATFTLVASTTSVSGSGAALTVVTRLTYANTGAAEAWGVRLTVPLPAGSTFGSATDGGAYDPVENTVSWYLDPVAASASGYVEMTTSRP